jgi:ribosomal protein L2
MPTRKTYISPHQLKVGDRIARLPTSNGGVPIIQIPLGTTIHNIE